MRPAMKITSAVLLSALPMIGSGCVQQDRYDNLLAANRSLKEQLVSSQDEIATGKANLNEVRRELMTARNSNDTLQGRIGGLEGDLDKQSGEAEKLMRRVSRLQLGPLPIEVEDALMTLASSHSDVLSFDPGQGMLRFASDFTFDLGSDAIKAGAAETLARVARILNSDASSKFEVQVIGHTDNVPIRNVGTRAKHPTNLHLSVHRAISVRNALVSEGVDPLRTQVAGYGEHRPVVPNRIGGAAQNRRVEIFLVPMKSGTLPTQDFSSAQIEKKTAEVEPMK